MPLAARICAKHFMHSYVLWINLIVFQVNLNVVACMSSPTSVAMSLFALSFNSYIPRWELSAVVYQVLTVVTAIHFP